ncbi:MAG: AMP-binding protein [Clostridia bacterium]|nr:AMP-binding protein [Clostridia bacterium]
MKYNPNYVYDVREFKSIRELIDANCVEYAERPAFLFKENKEEVVITYKKLFTDIKALSAYLCSNGFEGGKIAVTGKNSYTWALTYLATVCGVGVVVPIDRELSEKEVSFILEHSEADAVMISEDTAEKFENVDGVKKLYMDKMPEYLAEGQRLIDEGDTSYEKHTVDPYAMGAILYTSGTTGVAKGVMLSQNNIVSDIEHILRRVVLTPEDRTLSVLPLHHTYECTIGFIAMLYGGASIAYNESLRTLKKDLVDYKPTIFVSVPIILERFHKLVRDKYKKIKGGNGILSLQKAAAKISNYDVRRKIFSAVHEAFGGKLRLILCGAAPLDPNINRDYELFGIKVYIGYGLTETAPVCLMHSDFYRCADDNGYPMAGTYAKIVDANADGIGELAVKGPNVMLGYYKNPEETEKVMQDGWFLTGDLAYQNPENGTFKIVGRAKSMIVTPSGKKVFPEELEARLCESPLVEECLVFGTEGDGKTIITASIYPNTDEVMAVLSKKGFDENLAEENYGEFEKQTKALLTALITEINDEVLVYKVIKRLIVRKEEFEKTTTKKIKRNLESNLK